MSIMRIGGIASGFDTEQIVEDMMRIERLPLDRLYQQKVRAEWQRDEYRSINTKLTRLADMAFNLQFSGSYNLRQAVSSNKNIISVQATGDSHLGSYRIKVSQLASSGYVISGDQIADKFSQFIADLEGSEEPFTIRLKGLDNADTEFTEIQLTANETIESFVRKVNTHKDLGVNVYYDEHEDRFVFTSKSTGVESNVVFDTADPNTKSFFEEVLATVPEGGIEYQWAKTELGKNAILEINGLQTERSSNTFVLNGTQITLHSTSEEEVRVEVNQDTDKIFNMIKDFVELYNEVIQEVNTKLSEPYYRDFPPLTEEQKKDMTEREIELWEEKAKSGLLRSDRMLSSIVTDIRNTLTSAVKGLDGISSLSQIGIKTGPWYEKGKLHIDEAKLRETINERGEELVKLFTNSPGAESNEGAGIFRKLRTTLDNATKQISDKAGRDTSTYDQSSLSEQIRNYERRMELMEERLLTIENRYWAQFTAMEKALQQMYSQSDWLYQQLAALG